MKDRLTWTPTTKTNCKSCHNPVELAASAVAWGMVSTLTGFLSSCRSCHSHTLAHRQQEPKPKPSATSAFWEVFMCLLFSGVIGGTSSDACYLAGWASMRAGGVGLLFHGRCFTR